MGRAGGRGWGRPRVRNYRDDRLANLDPHEFERVVADYYRRHGYTVEHCGTGGGGRRFDGGIDLKMYRDGEYTIVQCKRENALQVTHNVGHELLGLLMTERADHAIVVNAGEFTHAAWTAAAKNPQLELIDGDRLRKMLPEYAVPVPQPASAAPTATPDARSAQTGGWQDWSLSIPNAKPAPFRVRFMDEHDREFDRHRRGRRGKQAYADGTNALIWLVVLGALVLWQCSRPKVPQRPVGQGGPVQLSRPSHVVAPATTPPPAPAPRETERIQVRPPRPPELAWTPPRGMTPAEAQEAQRRADEAMKVIEAHTPEMKYPPAR